MGFRNFYRTHRYLLVVAAAALIFYLAFFHNRLYGEINGSFISYGFVMGESYSEGSMPHWTPMLSGGYPLLANPEVPSFGILNLMIFLMDDVIMAFGITTLLHAVLAGLGASLLAFELTKSRHTAVVSGILFVISGTFSYAAFTGTMPFLYPLAFLPWVLLFAYRSMKKKSLVNVPLAGFFLSMQLLSGGTIYFFWTLLALGLFLGSYALFPLLKGKLNAAVSIGTALFFIVAFALAFAAVKLLPGIELIGLTNRAAGVDYQSFVWPFTQIQLSQLLPSILYSGSIIKVGFISFFLSLAGFLLNLRKKFALAFALMALISILIEVGTFLTKLFFELPGFGQTRQIYNVFSILSLSLAVMAGAGWGKLLLRLKKYRVAATAFLLVLIAVELLVLPPTPAVQPWERNFAAQLNENALLLEVASDTEMSRLHLYGEDFVGLSLAKYAIPLNIRMFDWTTGNVWFDDYISYSSVAGQLNSAKMWGMANVKYVASREPVNVSGLEFVGEFGECSICDLKARYLYRNSYFATAAFVVSNATLVIGDDQANFQNTYAIMNDRSFDPGKTAIVNTPSVPRNLRNYGLVMPATGAISQGDLSRLQDYDSSGGNVEPRLFDGDNQVDYSVMSSFFSNSGQVVEAEFSVYGPHSVALTAPASGLLVVGEKFYKFDYWKTSVNGKEADKLRVNLISTGVFVKEGDAVAFEYSNSAYKTGLAISLLAIIVAMALPFASGKLLKARRKSREHDKT